MRGEAQACRHTLEMWKGGMRKRHRLRFMQISDGPESVRLLTAELGIAGDRPTRPDGGLLGVME